jgi:phosphopantetheinyl transferase
LTRDPSKALERLMSDRDRELLVKFRPTEDSRLRPSLLLWTAKEAFSKALGLGMQAGMSRLEIDLEGPPPYRARTEVKGRFDLRDPLIHWEIRGDFLIALCTGTTALASGIERVSG